MPSNSVLKKTWDTFVNSSCKLKFDPNLNLQILIQICTYKRLIYEHIIYYFVVHFCNFVHYSFKPFKRSRFPSDPVEISIRSPSWSLASSWSYIWRCKAIGALVWSGCLTCFCVWLLHLTLWKLKTLDKKWNQINFLKRKP